LACRTLLRPISNTTDCVDDGRSTARVGGPRWNVSHVNTEEVRDNVRGMVLILVKNQVPFYPFSSSPMARAPEGSHGLEVHLSHVRGPGLNLINMRHCISHQLCRECGLVRSCLKLPNQKSALNEHVVGVQAILHLYKFTTITFLGYLVVIFEAQDEHLAKIQRTYQKKQSLSYLVS
jgi:hypothetical protein